MHDFRCFMIAQIKSFFLYQPSHYQIRIKIIICQTDSIITLNFELCWSGLSVSSCRLTIKCQRSVSCTHIKTKRLYSTDLMLHSKFSFPIFSLMFFPLFSKVFTDILRIYELSKYIMKYLNIAKTCLNNKHLPRQFYAQTALN